MKSKKIKGLYILFSICVTASVAIQASLPDRIMLFAGEESPLNVNSIVTVPGKCEDLSVEETNGIYHLKAEKTGSYDLDLKLFGVIPCKTVSVNVIQKEMLVPCGNAVGIKLYSDGLICVGFSEIDGKCPAREAGLREGDVVLEINGNKVTSNETFAKEIEACETEIGLKVKREDKIENFVVKPLTSGDGTHKIGMWVRDSVAGVGTLTFYDPKSKSFGALGHAISDIDTGSMYQVAAGELIGCDILAVQKGEKGTPGELQGRFEESVSLGNLESNTKNGIFAQADTLPDNMRQAVPVALKNEIKTGKATILSNVTGNTVEEFEIEVQYVFQQKGTQSKDMLIKVTDPKLLEKTGGIVQGMSGSPILQDGKLIGAVTHVFVNDPSRGYGVFIENMIDANNNSIGKK